MTNKTQEKQQKNLHFPQAEWYSGYGPYQYCISAEDQIKACIDGMEIKGTFQKRGDIQSDNIDISPSKEAIKKLVLQLLLKKNIIIYSASVWHNSIIEELNTSEPFDYQDNIQTLDIKADNSYRWTSSELARAIQNLNIESDMTHLREMIMIAEDTSFTLEQSKQLAPWFIRFAEKYRDSNNPQDEAPVLSAIRTGASMLHPQGTNSLIPLLDPGHPIETSLVTIKMIGRIFEAQPPTEIDKYKDLAEKVYPAAEIVQNPFAITISRTAAIAQLAIYALSAMASSKTLEIAKFVKQSGITWFIQQILHDLHELNGIWSNRNISINSQPQKLLGRIIKNIEVSNSSTSGGMNANN